MTLDLRLDFFPIVGACAAALACGLLGNFLVLRRLSLMGDAISHSVLPGLVIAFLLVSHESVPAIFIGAAIAGMTTVILVEVLQKLGRIEPGAAMGVSFSILFALGVLLLESPAARHAHIDADCLLYGQLETLTWFDAPDRVVDALSWSTIASAPRQVLTLLGVLLVVVGFIVVFFKELRITAFDPALATSLGINATLMHILLMLVVAGATVASFEAVGSILVIAMLICPGATARLLTDRLSTQIVWSAVVALASAISGYLLAAWIPGVIGIDGINAAGAMTVMLGFLFALTVVCSPTHGVLARSIRKRTLARATAIEDTLATLYRHHERGEHAITSDELTSMMRGRSIGSALRVLIKSDEVRTRDGMVELTSEGLDRAREVVRRHRLWESYLVDEAGIDPDHVHTTAEQLEHLASVLPSVRSDRDPHGKRIPGARGDD